MASIVEQRLSGGRFKLKRSLLKVFGAEYHIHDEAGNLLCMADQRGFQWNQLNIEVYPDQRKLAPLMTILGQQAVLLDIAGTWNVVDDSTMEPVCVLQRQALRSFVRDEWAVYNPSGMHIGSVVEDSMTLALIRRFVLNLIPQRYVVMVGNVKVADLRQNFNPFSFHLKCELTGSGDPRIALAAAILLAAIDGKQSSNKVPINPGLFP